MSSIMDILNIPFGYILSFCYSFLKNYGLAIILFTILVKLLMLPLGIKQKKSMVKQMAMRPKEDAIRRKYKNDQNKMNQAIMDLYKEEGFNPMGGCLPLLIQFPIIISLYQVINKPLTYIMHLSQETLSKVMEVLGYTPIPGYYEINLAQEMSANYDKIADLIGNAPIVDFNFLGLPLSNTPSFSHPSLLWIIPILAGATALLSGIYSQKSMPAPEGTAGATTKSMMYIMPIFSLFICFQMPAGVGLYWAMSSLLSFVQEFALNRIYKPQETAARIRAEVEAAERAAKKKKKRPVNPDALPGEGKPGEGGGKKPARKKAPDAFDIETLMDKKKPISYAFEDDPAVIAKIKAYNASLLAEQSGETEPEESGAEPALPDEGKSFAEIEAENERKDSAHD